jgi:mRNA interferase RelE/StbE
LTYVIQITPTALEMIKGVRDRRVNDLIQKRIDQLSKDPDKQGKELHGDLWGYRCVRAVGQRYRILYRVKGTAVMVLVVAVGIRREKDKKDIYALAQKMIRLGLIDPIAEK